MPKFTKHILISFLSLTVLLGAYAGLQWLLDPFQFFHDHFFSEQSYYRDMRHQAPGLIRKFIADSNKHSCVISGTSLSQNFDMQEAAYAFPEENWIQLSASGASPREQDYILRKALDTGKVKLVIKELDNTYINNDTQYLRKDSFPVNYYSSVPIKYLLGMDTLIAFIQRRYNDEKWSKNHNTLGRWFEKRRHRFVEWNSAKNLQKIQAELDAYRLNQLREPTNRHSNIFRSIDTYVVKLANDYPKTTFLLFLPPVSTLYYAEMSGQELKTILDMQEYLITETKQTKNIRIYGFQNVFSLTNNLANYSDRIHYSAQVSSWILDKISQNAHMLSTQTWPHYRSQVESAIQTYTVSSSPYESMTHELYETQN